MTARVHSGFANAADFGFSPDASGMENAAALQRALDGGGTVVVARPGVYNLARTVYIGSNTSLICGNGVFLKKVPEQGVFMHVLLNKGALTRTFDTNIVVDGLHIIVNSVDGGEFEVYGLRGQAAFFYAKDLRIARFRCLDLGRAQYALHVCTFEDVIIDDVIIKGRKDGVHFGRGRRFSVRNGVFETFDDAVALNGHDYSTGNPELGWIEDGVVEKCRDLNAPATTGFFCRVLAGAWRDWQEGMEVQQSDSVVRNGRVYRVWAQPDGRKYRSVHPPGHERGMQVLDGIPWGVAQCDAAHTAGVRNVLFRDIVLEKPRIGFALNFENDQYCRSYYPGSEVPVQEGLTFENLRVAHDAPLPLINVATPIDVLNICNSSLKNNPVCFYSNSDVSDFLKTSVNMTGCVFKHDGAMRLLTNGVDNKDISFKTTASVERGNFSASVAPGNGRISVESDLAGLKK